MPDFILPKTGLPGLQETRSSFFPQDMVTSKHGKSIFGRVHAVLVAFGIGILVLLRSRALIPIIWAIFLTAFGLIFILVGWLEFSLLEEVESVPSAKIDAAADGVSEVSGQVLPEKGDCLISPLSKQKCVYYWIDLQQYIGEGNKNSRWAECASCSKGVPALLSDGTGYLAVDLESADLSVKSIEYYPVDGNGHMVGTGTPEGIELTQVIQKTDNANLNLAGMGISFQDTTGKGLSVFSKGGNELRVVETAIPVGTNYFAMGRIDGAEKDLQGKPVKLMTYDSHTKILTVRDESKQQIETHDKLLSLGSLGLGFLIFLAGLGLFVAFGAGFTYGQPAYVTTTVGYYMPPTSIWQYNTTTWENTTSLTTTPLYITSSPLPGSRPDFIAQFNGFDSHISLPGNEPIGNFTVSVFVNATGTDENFPNIFSLGPGASSGGFQVGLDSSGHPYVGISLQNGFSYYAAPSIFPKETWMHLAVTFDGSSLTFYTDGAKFYTYQVSGVHEYQPSFECIGAWRCEYQSWHGSMSDLQVYSTALTQDQIHALYAQGMTGWPISLIGLVGWWPLNGTSKDYSGNHNDGIDTNMTYMPYS